MAGWPPFKREFCQIYLPIRKTVFKALNHNPIVFSLLADTYRGVLVQATVKKIKSFFPLFFCFIVLIIQRLVLKNKQKPCTLCKILTRSTFLCMPQVACRMLHGASYMSHVACHKLPVACRVSRLVCQVSGSGARV